QVHRHQQRRLRRRRLTLRAGHPTTHHRHQRVIPALPRRPPVLLTGGLHLLGRRRRRQRGPQHRPHRLVVRVVAEGPDDPFHRPVRQRRLVHVPQLPPRLGPLLVVL